ncbi:hypothetical protein VNI00_003433 [Paramarasmius palmivorus]|uniref:F-box domain-containing protein n=1 Tax=Paramarasmius palmivorus TaxID=297713 RepID=A0AAW0DUC6_9AGAR
MGSAIGTEPEVLEAALSTTDQSALRELLHLASSSNRRVIARALCDAENTIRYYEAEIAQLLAQRQRFVRRAERCRSLLSPVKNIPPEILSLIFEFYCQKNILLPDTLSPASTLCAVCYRWQQIALSIPRLWSSLDIDFSSWGTRHGSRLARTIQAFMERSKTNPLTLRLKIDEEDDSDDDSDEDVNSPLDRINRSALEILVRNSCRWFDVEFDGPTDILDHDDFLPIGGCLPRLRYVNFGLVEPYGLFSDAPSLCSVTYTPGSNVPVPSLPLDHIKLLELRECDGPSALRMLQACKAIEELKLYWVGGGVAEALMEAFPSMNTLRVETRDECDISLVLQLTLPVVTLIELKCFDKRRTELGWTVWDTSSVQTFFGDSPILELRLDNLPITDTQVIGILSCLPSLRKLHIRDLGRWVLDGPPGRQTGNRTITSPFFQSLTAVGPSDTVLIPRLTDLTLDASGDMFDPGPLLKLIQSRLGHDSGEIENLHSVHLQLRGEGSTPGVTTPISDHTFPGLQFTGPSL